MKMDRFKYRVFFYYYYYFFFFKLAHTCFLSVLLITYLIFPYILSNEWALFNNRAGTCCQLFNVLMFLLCLESWTSQVFIQLEVWASSHLLLQIATLVPFQVCIARAPALIYSRVSRSYTGVLWILLFLDWSMRIRTLRHNATINSNYHVFWFSNKKNFTSGFSNNFFST